MINSMLVNLFYEFLIILILITGICLCAVLLYTLYLAYVYKDFNKAMCECSDKLSDFFEKYFG